MPGRNSETKFATYYDRPKTLSVTTGNGKSRRWVLILRLLSWLARAGSHLRRRKKYQKEVSPILVHQSHARDEIGTDLYLLELNGTLPVQAPAGVPILG